MMTPSSRSTGMTTMSGRSFGGRFAGSCTSAVIGRRHDTRKRVEQLVVAVRAMSPTYARGKGIRYLRSHSVLGIFAKDAEQRNSGGGGGCAGSCDDVPGSAGQKIGGFCHVGKGRRESGRRD